MRRRKLSAFIVAICAAFALSVALPSCNVFHRQRGADREYSYPDNGNHQTKPKKQKKQKEPKPQKQQPHGEFR